MHGNCSFLPQVCEAMPNLSIFPVGQKFGIWRLCRGHGLLQRGVRDRNGDVMDRRSIDLQAFSRKHAVGWTAIALILALGVNLQAQDATGWPSYPVTQSPPVFLEANRSYDLAMVREDPTLPDDSLFPIDDLASQPDTAAMMASYQSQSAGGVRAGGWCWQTAPEGLIYRSYMAGPKESRLAAQWVHKAGEGWFWDVTLGGQAGLVRYGTTNANQPEGWQLDVEGAALGSLDLETASNDLQAADYRVGVPLTYGRGNHQTKLAYYHISSHLGDELMIAQPGITRINYVRDAVVLGHSYYLLDGFRMYGEIGYAFNVDGGAEPWEFQFGIEYSPIQPTGMVPVLFYAFNGHLREELDFGGNIAVQAGVQWRGVTGRRMRLGMQYVAGMSDQYEFFDQHEDKLGMGVWYDF